MKLSPSLLVSAACIAVVASAPSPFSAQVADAYSKNNDGVLYWGAVRVVSGHNDLTKRFPAGTCVKEMYNSCLAYCKEKRCHTFDLVFDKSLCYFDLTSQGPIKKRPDPNNPCVPFEALDNNAAYVAMKPYPAPKPPTTSSRPPTPTPKPPVPSSTPPTPSFEGCYGFGLKWETAAPFIADGLPSRDAVLADLTEQCGSGDQVCKKWIVCSTTSVDKCGALAVAPDTKQAGAQSTPGVAFAPSRATASAKAMASCQKRLDDEGITGECEVVASFCRA